MGVPIDSYIFILINPFYLEAVPHSQSGSETEIRVCNPYRTGTQAFLKK